MHDDLAPRNPLYEDHGILHEYPDMSQVLETVLLLSRHGDLGDLPPNVGAGLRG